MKKAIFFIICALFISIASNAQNSVTVHNKTIKVEKTIQQSDIKTSWNYEDSKNGSYPIWIHKISRGENVGKWVAYVNKVSKKSGKEYKYYLKLDEEYLNKILKDTL